MIIAKGKKFGVNVSLGIVGGIVEFEECYGSATMAGLYDRTTFGLCPEPFQYYYEPFEATDSLSSVPVNVHREVWELKNEWLKTVPGMTGRVAENALRAASICASFDGRNLLLPQDLGPALELAKYQIRVREVKRPNPGQNPDAVCAFTVLQKLALAPPGEWVSKRQIARAIHAERLGPGVFRRAGENLFMNGEIERLFSGATKKNEYWRLTEQGESDE
jgi:hypothetical protein